MEHLIHITHRMPSMPSKPMLPITDHATPETPRQGATAAPSAAHRHHARCRRDQQSPPWYPPLLHAATLQYNHTRHARASAVARAHAPFCKATPITSQLRPSRRRGSQRPIGFATGCEWAAGAFHGRLEKPHAHPVCGGSCSTALLPCSSGAPRDSTSRTAQARTRGAFSRRQCRRTGNVSLPGSAT